MNTIVFASAKGQVGKSTLCRLYAEYYAVEKKLKTLVIESNFFTSGKEYPISCELPKTIDEFILSSVAENIPDSELPSYINSTELANLFILPTKRISDQDIYSPADEEAKDNIRKLLAVESTTKFITSCIQRINKYALEEKFDFFLIDTTSDTSPNLNLTLIDRVLTSSFINGHVMAIAETNFEVLKETIIFIYKNAGRTKTSIEQQTLITNKTPTDDQIDEVCRIEEDDQCFDKQLKEAAEKQNVVNFILSQANVPFVLKDNQDALKGLEELYIPFEIRLKSSSPLPQPKELLKKLEALQPNIQATADRILELC
ncbi:MAG: hypothetical protein HZB44_08480 [Actinobacteria bacterium]|nr:hypothetical protein [Actinomycetota bacterium]